MPGDIDLKAEDEVERDVEEEEEHLQDVLEDVCLVNHTRPLQGHAHLHTHVKGKIIFGVLGDYPFRFLSCIFIRLYK